MQVNPKRHVCNFNLVEVEETMVANDFNMVTGYLSMDAVQTVKCPETTVQSVKLLRPYTP